MNAQNVVDAISAAVETLNAHGCNYRVYPQNISSVKNLIEAINPQFPRDSVDVLDLLNVVVNHGSLPDSDEIEILEEVLRDADFYGGDLRWKYRHPVITAEFSPKSGGHYTIRFVPLSNDLKETGTHPLCFPLKMSVLIWTDMDLQENHTDVCPMYYPEHDDDCPLRIAYESGEFPETKEEQAALEEQCECGSDDCNCESTVERVEERIFNTHQEWKDGIAEFMLKAHWGGKEEETA